MTMSMKLVIAATAVLAAFAVPALAHEAGPKHQMHRQARASVAPSTTTVPVFDEGARAAYGANVDFTAWPTDFLANRFGDRQMQGR
jgi:hypothetical protein